MNYTTSMPASFSCSMASSVFKNTSAKSLYFQSEIRTKIEHIFSLQAQRDSVIEDRGTILTQVPLCEYNTVVSEMNHIITCAIQDLDSHLMTHLTKNPTEQAMIQSIFSSSDYVMANSEKKYLN